MKPWFSRSFWMAVLCCWFVSCDTSDGGGFAPGAEQNCPNGATRCSMDFSEVELCSAGQWVIKERCADGQGVCVDRDAMILCDYPQDGDFEYNPPDGDLWEDGDLEDADQETDGDEDLLEDEEDELESPEKEEKEETEEDEIPLDGDEEQSDEEAAEEGNEEPEEEEDAGDDEDETESDT